MSLADRVYDWLWFYLASLRKVVSGTEIDPT